MSVSARRIAHELAGRAARGVRLLGAWIKRFLLDELDTWLKLLGAIAIAVGTVVAASWESRYSAVSVLNQREQAESELRTSMLESLITPILAERQPDQAIDANQQRVIAELLTLNFHRHFEFKPLLLNVYHRLEGDEAGRASLASVTRRVMDRQISMLSALSHSMNENAAIATDVYFSDVASRYPGGRSTPHGIIGCGTADSPNGPLPNLYGWYRSMHESKVLPITTACLTSPDDRYRALLSPREIDYENETIELQLSIESVESSDVITDLGFGLTAFDLPLTDNSVIDADNRFAVVLYDMQRGDDGERSPDADANPDTGQVQQQAVPQNASPPYVKLTFVWFPPGYISDRERPLNFSEIRDLLGVSAH